MAPQAAHSRIVSLEASTPSEPRQSKADPGLLPQSMALMWNPIRVAVTIAVARALSPRSPAAPPSASLGPAIGRKGFFVGAAAAAASSLSGAAPASAAETQSIKTKFGTSTGDGSPLSSATFSVPESWVRLNGDVAGGRQLVLFADPGNSDTNAFVLITPIRGDYTSLGSFGNLETVQETVMPPADGIEYNLVSAAASTGKYTYEYKIQVPNQPKRHLTTIFMVQSDCIVTFNVQAKEEDYTPAVASLSKTIVDSFKTGKA